MYTQLSSVPMDIFNPELLKALADYISQYDFDHCSVHNKFLLDLVNNIFPKYSDINQRVFFNALLKTIDLLLPNKIIVESKDFKIFKTYATAFLSGKLIYYLSFNTDGRIRAQEQLKAHVPENSL